MSETLQVTRRSLVQRQALLSSWAQAQNVVLDYLQLTHNKKSLAWSCAQGHAGSDTFQNIEDRGGVICLSCKNGSLQRPEQVASRLKFEHILQQQGARYFNNVVYVAQKVPVRIVCINGHVSDVLPASAIAKGIGVCKYCGLEKVELKRTQTAERFYAALQDRGIRLADGALYVNNKTRVAVVCGEGHRTTIRPIHALARNSFCSECQVSYDRLYLVYHADSKAIKVGIASSDERVATHKRNGYVLVCQWDGLTSERARQVEKLTLRAARAQGWVFVASAPVDGLTETMPVAAFEFVLAQVGKRLGEPSLGLRPVVPVG